MSWERIEAVAWVVFAGVLCFYNQTEHPKTALLLAWCVGLWTAALVKRERAKSDE